MTILSPVNLKESILGYLETLNKENIFEYYPTKKGLTQKGEDINLGFSCYALKCFHILNNTSLLTEKNKKEWGSYLNNYQIKSARFPNYSYIDENYLSNYENIDTTKLLKESVKRSINLLKPNRFETLEQKLINSIRAETKQTISTLSEIGQSPKNKYLEFPQDETEIKYFLNTLNWNKPWASGAQFASLCVFTKTQLQDSKYQKTQAILAEFSSILANSVTGAYHLSYVPSNQELINGSMKIISGLDWIDIQIHFPEKLIDLCLSIKPETEGCDLVDIIYVLYKCSQQSPHRKKDIDRFFSEMHSKIFLNFNSDDGSFSYFTKKSQTHYYGVKITEGLNTADIHGTTLLLWALSMIYTFKEEDSIKLNIIKP
mgnify:CR=1 FL=1